MKLVVMIPAYNEEKTIGDVIRGIPKKIEGIEKIEVLVVDDGSTDDTVKVAGKAGADHMVSHKKNRGLGWAFQTGLNKALELGAGIIVNLDADNQYNQKEIPRLITPILDDEADVVLTDRNVGSLDHMDVGKKYGNMIASFVTRTVSGYPVKDSQSGFRAFNSEAALKLNVLSGYTYVQETIIQAKYMGLRIVQVPCEFRRRDGRSRLISNIFSYAKKAGSIILRTYVRYRPLKVFLSLGFIIFSMGFALVMRYLYYYMMGAGSGKIQSLILAAVLMLVGFQIAVLALVADTIDAGRRINEEILYRLKKMRIGD
jgi:glycosyltransferase involved in cell wall biosynthesis